MTQYPPPPDPQQQPPSYLPPPPRMDYYQSAIDPLAPARRASIVMIVLGCLMLLCGAYLGIGSTIADWNQVYATEEKMMPPGSMDQITPAMLRGAAVGMAVGSLLLAVLLTGLGIAVRRGGGIAIGGSIALTAIVIVVLSCPALGTIPILAKSPAVGVAGLLMLGAPLVALLAQLYWLIAAMRAGSIARSMQWQAQAQHLKYQQQYQTFSQGNYGYATAPPQTPSQQPAQPQAPQPRPSPPPPQGQWPPQPPVA